MANGNGNAVWTRWVIGLVALVFLGWLAALEVEVDASEERVTHRLDRIEGKLDRLLERQ